MRSRDAQDELVDGFEPSPLPPMGPDGAVRLESAAPLPPDPPRLCEFGPCRHYHRMVIQLDAQQPGTERRADGRIVVHGRVFHTETHHYCYPDVGIETNLGSLPVLECNRWVPLRRLWRTGGSVKRDYDRALHAFQVAQNVDLEQAQRAADASDEPTKLIVEFYVDGASFGTYIGETNAHELVSRVIGRALCEIPGLAQRVVEDDLFTYGVSLNNEKLANVDASFGELGVPLGAFDKVTVTVIYMKENV